MYDVRCPIRLLSQCETVESFWQRFRTVVGGESESLIGSLQFDVTLGRVAVNRVDPGHGGKDPGTQGVSAIPEKEFNLLLTAELNRALIRREARVVPTRTTDTFVTLEHRALIARRSRADLFVSIHADWIRKRHSTGATLYIARSPSSKSIRAADCIAAAFRAAGIKCNGIRRRDFRVLVEHPQPAVLIECGYMSNWADARRLNSPAYRTRLVEAITDGIATHFTR